jgi:energy-converting hydrogenase Eha subunit E
MSLLSYNNGVALVSLEAVHDLDTDVLARAVTRAMSREARVETHNERTLVIKLAED